MKMTPIVLVAAVIGAGGYAAFANNRTPSSAPVAAQAQAPASPAPLGAADLSGESDPPLPPNHPPIGQAGAPGAGGSNDFAPADQEPASLKWTTPAAWTKMPNPSTMRLATNKIPRVAGDSEDAELSISRAGGDTKANIDRWVGQFAGAGKDKQRTKTVKGFKVTIVEVDGSYSGGMGAQAGTHEGWALMGAIVETPGQPYFFKLIGPANTVHGARASFDSMLDGLSPN